MISPSLLRFVKFAGNDYFEDTDTYFHKATFEYQFSLSVFETFKYRMNQNAQD